jgi:5-methyltetrahydrofolate--homocysteine methyltransferase
MLIIAEKINSSRKAIAEAVKEKNTQFIIDIAQRQAEAGADYIDLNVGTFLEQEAQYLCWLVETVQQAVDLPLCLDSPDPKALGAAMKIHRGEPMINSISLEKDRYEALLPIITDRPCHVIALCMSQTAMPKTTEDRVRAGEEIIGRLQKEGIPPDKILVDPLIQPVSVDTQMGLEALGAIKAFAETFPEVSTVCGLSNISFGLPCRSLLNRNFLVLAASSGLSAAILDPTDQKLMAALRAAEVLINKDEYCERFIDAYQQGVLDV